MKYIYALVSGQLILYVGQTVNLKDRERHHRADYNDCASRYIPDYIDWTMKVLEVVENKEAKIKECHYYDILKPLYNEVRPILDKERKEKTRKICNVRYRVENREKLAQYDRDRYPIRFEETKEYRKEYYSREDVKERNRKRQRELYKLKKEKESVIL